MANRFLKYAGIGAILVLLFQGSIYTFNRGCVWSALAIAGIGISLSVILILKLVDGVIIKHGNEAKSNSHSGYTGHTGHAGCKGYTGLQDDWGKNVTGPGPKRF